MTDIREVNELIGIQDVWDDLVGSLISRRLDSIAGTVDYNYAENAVTMQPGGNPANSSDRIVFNYQYPHACVVDGVMKLHIHYEQVNTNELTFQTDYRIQINGGTKVTAWTTVQSNSTDNNVFPYVSGTLNQKLNLAVIDLTGAGMSATVQFRVTRTDATVGDIDATFIDAHVNRDMVGSRSEHIK